jgi:flavin-dependent dehydrogenase
MRRAYQAIIVGARCAGSPMAMLLARKGYRVLMVDRANFPSDTLSTHVVQPLGAAAAHAAEVLKRDPKFSVGAYLATQHYKHEGDRIRHKAGLRSAGLQV